MSVSPPPLPFNIVDTILSWLSIFAHHRDSLTINIDIHGFLRANKIYKIKSVEFYLQGHVRLFEFGSHRALSVFTNSRTGEKQFVSLTDHVLLQQLQRSVNKTYRINFTSFVQ